MEENKNKRPRPRRSIEDVAPTPKPSAPKTARAAEPRPVRPAAPKTEMPKPMPAPAPKTEAPRPKPMPKPMPAQKPVEKQAAPNPSPEKPVEKPMPKPAPEQDEYEETRLSQALPKAKLKTPVRTKAEEEEESSGVAGGIFKAILYMTAVLVAGVLLAYGVILVGNDVFAFVKSEAAVEVVIPENATVQDISEILGDADVIAYPALFRLYAQFQGVDGVDDEGNSIFIPGTYTISPMKNYMQLLAAFQKQYTRDTVWVTFPEGSTVEEMITVLVEEHGIASREDFVRAINEYDYGMEFLEGLEEKEGRYYRLEGYLFPDTYQFYTDSNAETVVYKMLDNFAKKLSYIGDDYCKERLDELGMTLDEVVTLASMVEKEVKYAVDYDQVSSVFHNRLGDRATHSPLWVP